MDSGNQKWQFHIMARTNRTCSGKTLFQVISNSKGSSQSAEDEHKINKNQRRKKYGHYRKGFRLRGKKTIAYRPQQ
jgi:hypothetical protein